MPFCIEECLVPNVNYSNLDFYKVYLFMLKVDKIINQESFNCWSAEQGGDNSPKKRLSIWKNLIYHLVFNRRGGGSIT